VVLVPTLDQSMIHLYGFPDMHILQTSWNQYSLDLLNDFCQMSYTERLARLYAETLELRCLKLDLSMIFCTIRSYVNIDGDRLFVTIDCGSSRIRGHNFKVQYSNSILI